MILAILITGFLGSGKTTFVNYLLAKYPNIKFSVILNEFGDIKLESQFIKSHKKDVVELANGCMCCIAKSDVPRVISLILENSPQTEYLLIEASGLSDPDPIHESFNDPRVFGKVFLAKVVCIVDALNFLEMKNTHPTIMAQLSDADLAVISKVKEAGIERSNQIQNLIKNLMPLTRVVLFDDSFDSSELFAVKANSLSDDYEKDKNDHHHVHEKFKEYWFVSSNSYSRKDIEDAYKNLPESVLRSKGIVVSRDGKKILIQYVKGKLELLEASWSEDEEKKTQILFIGKDFDEKEMEKLF
ncbi:MAG: GTP-binding protein [Patescibacteria group bacterium]|nr:GTP-binding protein [Patescibacteria group bacterium]